MTPDPSPAEEPQEQQKPAGDPPAKLSDDPRARRALEKKNPAGGQAPGSQGAGHSKAANSSSKQGKREKKVRW